VQCFFASEERRDKNPFPLLGGKKKKSIHLPARSFSPRNLLSMPRCFVSRCSARRGVEVVAEELPLTRCAPARQGSLPACASRSSPRSCRPGAPCRGSCRATAAKVRAHPPRFFARRQGAPSAPMTNPATKATREVVACSPLPLARSRALRWPPPIAAPCSEPRTAVAATHCCPLAQSHQCLCKCIGFLEFFTVEEGKHSLCKGSLLLLQDYKRQNITPKTVPLAPVTHDSRSFTIDFFLPPSSVN
jgi:hypothetical protein